jgi:hypothetical protein
MKAILVHFEPKVLAQLQAQRARTGCSVSEFVRRCVRSGLDPKSGIEARMIDAAELAAAEIQNQEVKAQQT